MQLAPSGVVTRKYARTDASPASGRTVHSGPSQRVTSFAASEGSVLTSRRAAEQSSRRATLTRRLDGSSTRLLLFRRGAFFVFVRVADGDAFDHGRRDRRLAATGRRRDLVDDVHPLGDLTEDRVLPVEL